MPALLLGSILGKGIWMVDGQVTSGSIAVGLPFKYYF